MVDLSDDIINLIQLAILQVKRLLRCPTVAAASDEYEQVMVDLPDDIINLILATLPLKSLLRSRTVCKQWNATITSHAFATLRISMRESTLSACTVVHSLHDRHNSSRLRAIQISTSHRSSPAALSYSSIKLGSRTARHGVCYYHILSSCNGLLCVAGLPFLNFDRVITTMFIRVCNPATGNYMEIEPPQVAVDWIGLSLVLGLGYDPTVDDYKIVCTFKTTFGRTPKRVVLVKSLKSDAWRFVDTSTSSPDLACVMSAVANGNSAVACSASLYWTVITYRGGRSIVMILKFNLTEERFELLPFPDKAAVVGNEVTRNDIFCKLLSTLASHKGSLYIFVPQHSDYTTSRIMASNQLVFTSKIDIWMLDRMDGNNAIWLRMGVIPTFEGAMLHPLGFNWSGHIIMKNRQCEHGLINLYTYLPKENEFLELGTTSCNLNVHLVQMETLALNKW